MLTDQERERVRHLAYELWIQEGRPADRHLVHWRAALHRLHAQGQLSDEALADNSSCAFQTVSEGYDVYASLSGFARGAS